jgi:hypothetical protein
MGYDIHITRKEFWADEEGPDITLDEWQEYLKTDPTIEPDPVNPGEENYILTSHPEKWPIWWNSSGEIYTKNPDPEVITKFVEIARVMQASVQGDDGEEYGLDPDDPTKPS